MTSLIWVKKSFETIFNTIVTNSGFFLAKKRMLLEQIRCEAPPYYHTPSIFPSVDFSRASFKHDQV